MNTPTIPHKQQQRLRAHFGLTGLPFRKNVVASRMFDSTSQRELRHGLHLWLEIQGLGLVTGPSGVGKSISLRRLTTELAAGHYEVHRIGQIPTTPAGFLRALTRHLGLRPRLYLADMFDDVRAALVRHADDKGTHPVLIFDDAEGMQVDTLDLVRRLTAHELDEDHHVSILLAGTDRLLETLRDPMLVPLCTRFSYVHALRPFGTEDARNYVRFHLQGAGAPENLFTDGAVQALFQTSQGVPRVINQLALQAMVDAVVRGLDQVDATLMRRVLHTHPLYAVSGTAA